MNDQSFDELVQETRKLRGREDMRIKPSPYLRDIFTDEFGNTNPVELRNYQKIGVMNMLMQDRFILGDDAGLGKTLQVLTTIGYIWMQEPEYVPIIVTTKSALHQWGKETNKFMHMNAVVVDDSPYERTSIYESFFSDTEKKILIMSYDTFIRDYEDRYIRDESVKVKASDKRTIKPFRDAFTQARDLVKKASDDFEKAIKNFSFEEHEYVKSVLSGGTDPPPSSWNERKKSELYKFLSIRTTFTKAKQKYDEIYNKFNPSVLVNGIISFIKQRKEKVKNSKFMLVLDEVHKIKNHKNVFHRAAFQVGEFCDRVIGMTATPIKNRLEEFWNIFKVVKPGLFSTAKEFNNEYCIMKLQRVNGGRMVPIIVGYRNLESFKARIEPFFLSRKKHEVAKELPEVINKEVECVLSDIQQELYSMAELGTLNVDEDSDSSSILSSLVLCQQAANCPQLISDNDGNQFDGPSSKIEAMIDIVEKLPDQKIIIFSRFEQMITKSSEALTKAGIKSVRITGEESDTKIREKNRLEFQNMNSNTNVIFLTLAGSESLNLQAAGVVIFLDLPWSWGDLVQLIGRAVRIGSMRDSVVAFFLLAKQQNGKPTIDEHVLKSLRNKKNLSDNVSGVAIKNALVFSKEKDMVQDLFQAIRTEASLKSSGKGPTEQKIKSTSKRKKTEEKKSLHDNTELVIDMSPPVIENKPSVTTNTHQIIYTSLDDLKHVNL